MGEQQAPDARYRYSVFGVDILSTGSGLGNRLKFSAKRFDESSKTYDFRTRNYHPKVGRFLQRDRAGMAEGTNLYSYARHRPLSFSDINGTDSRSENREMISQLKEVQSNALFLDSLLDVYGTSFVQRVLQSSVDDVLRARAAIVKVDQNLQVLNRANKNGSLNSLVRAEEASLQKALEYAGERAKSAERFQAFFRGGTKTAFAAVKALAYLAEYQRRSEEGQGATQRVVGTVVSSGSAVHASGYFLQNKKPLGLAELVVTGVDLGLRAAGAPDEVTDVTGVGVSLTPTSIISEGVTNAFDFGTVIVTKDLEQTRKLNDKALRVPVLSGFNMGGRVLFDDYHEVETLLTDDKVADDSILIYAGNFWGELVFDLLN